MSDKKKNGESTEALTRKDLGVENFKERTSNNHEKMIIQESHDRILDPIRDTHAPPPSLSKGSKGTKEK
ncbi:hypothetical protein KOI40_00555 [Aestuariicella sp. G3-2]|uniref:hypothetical protein n=1 Tax=Pseudomaricurvus albidus TaxID=2842452 RepID=UPI001C0CF6CE|nr:hypothetical protein [Aestuariicella albida]MBU3068283.1 hypothetical protein [Aestuariicella albida]